MDAVYHNWCILPSGKSGPRLCRTARWLLRCCDGKSWVILMVDPQCSAGLPNGYIQPHAERVGCSRLLARLLRIVFQHNRNVHFAWPGYADTHVVSRPATVFEPKIAVSGGDIDVETDGISPGTPVGDARNGQVHRRRRIALRRATHRGRTATCDFPMTGLGPAVLELRYKKLLRGQDQVATLPCMALGGPSPLDNRWLCW